MIRFCFLVIAIGIILVGCGSETPFDVITQEAFDMVLRQEVDPTETYNQNLSSFEGMSPVQMTETITNSTGEYYNFTFFIKKIVDIEVEIPDQHKLSYTNTDYTKLIHYAPSRHPHWAQSLNLNQEQPSSEVLGVAFELIAPRHIISQLQQDQHYILTVRINDIRSRSVEYGNNKLIYWVECFYLE